MMGRCTIVVMSVVAVALLASACEADGPEGASGEARGEMVGDEGAFFDEDLIMEGAEELGGEAAEVECVGQETSRRLAGRVLAPEGRLAMRNASWWDRVIPAAHAAPLEGELPAGGVEVYLARVDERGEPVGDALQKTSTDPYGQWCIYMSQEADFGPTLMLIASDGERRLRRPVLHQNDVDIYSQPEALVRLLIEEGLLLEELDVDTYLNLDVMAQTAVDLLQPVSLRSGAGLDSLLARLDSTMREDARLMAAVERVHQAAQAE